MKGLDYSFGRPGGAAIVDAGFEFVVRYVPYQGDGGKGLTAGELEELRANGLAVGLVFESVAERHLDGRPAGIEDARRCAAAVAELGFPDDLPVYFAVDFDAQPNQQGLINAYQLGAADVLGMERVGVYGSYGVVERCFAAATATWFWQTYAWSKGFISQRAHLYQYKNGQTLNGAAVDYNEAFGERQGLWRTEEDELNENDKAILDKAAAAGDQMYQQVFGLEDGPAAGYIEDEHGNVFTLRKALERIQALEQRDAGALPPGTHFEAVTK